MKAFVTGATGFVGSHLAAALVERGDTVVCLARRPEQAAFIASLGALVAPGALEDGAALSAALSDAEVVYHVAGLTAAPSEQAFLEVNEAGTRRLIEAAHRAAPHLQRFVYVSSIAAVGPAPRGGRLAEDAPCRPVTAYGRSKLAGEAVVRRSPALPWSIVRPGVVYGPRDRELLRLFRITRLGFAPVFGLGHQQVSIVHVVDLAEAIVRAALEPRALGQTYHVAHPTPVTQRELAMAVGRAAAAPRSCCRCRRSSRRRSSAPSGGRPRRRGAGRSWTRTSSPSFWRRRGPPRWRRRNGSWAGGRAAPWRRGSMRPRRGTGRRGG